MTQYTERVVEVTTVTQLRVRIRDNRLTPEFLAEFSEFMFPMETPEQMFKHVAELLARDYTSVECVGDATLINGRPAPIQYLVEDTFTEANITEHE